MKLRMSSDKDDSHPEKYMAGGAPILNTRRLTAGERMLLPVQNVVHSDLVQSVLLVWYPRIWATMDQHVLRRCWVK